MPPGAKAESELAAAAARALPSGRLVVLPRGRDQEPVEVPPSVVRVVAGKTPSATFDDTVPGP